MLLFIAHTQRETHTSLALSPHTNMCGNKQQDKTSAQTQDQHVQAKKRERKRKEK